MTAAPATASAAWAGSARSARRLVAPGTDVPERVTTAGSMPRLVRAATTARPTGPAPRTTWLADMAVTSGGGISERCSGFVDILPNGVRIARGVLVSLVT